MSENMYTREYSTSRKTRREALMGAFVLNYDQSFKMAPSEQEF
jgi:hypothetical protein